MKVYLTRNDVGRIPPSTHVSTRGHAHQLGHLHHQVSFTNTYTHSLGIMAPDQTFCVRGRPILCLIIGFCKPSLFIEFERKLHLFQIHLLAVLAFDERIQTHFHFTLMKVCSKQSKETKDKVVY